MNEEGCSCERCDGDVFIGVILERLKLRMPDSTMVIADLSGSNPKVYLEVGYSLGKRVPTLLVVREGAELSFHIKNQNLIIYKNILHLRKQLGVFIRSMIGQ